MLIEDWYRGQRYEDYRGVERLDNFKPSRPPASDRLCVGSSGDGESFSRGVSRNKGRGSSGAQ